MTLRQGKQLPNGTKAAVIKEYGIADRDVDYRMKFAEKFSTETEVRTAVRTYGSWTAIRKKALTDEPRHKPKPKPKPPPPQPKPSAAEVVKARCQTVLRRRPEGTARRAGDGCAAP